ncbi:MAG: hypothetical protein ACYTBV_18970, partial [Planctomycetota bacterium]
EAEKAGTNVSWGNESGEKTIFTPEQLDSLENDAQKAITHRQGEARDRIYREVKEFHHPERFGKETERTPEEIDAKREQLWKWALAEQELGYMTEGQLTNMENLIFSKEVDAMSPAAEYQLTKDIAAYDPNAGTPEEAIQRKNDLFDRIAGGGISRERQIKYLTDLDGTHNGTGALKGIQKERFSAVESRLQDKMESDDDFLANPDDPDGTEDDRRMSRYLAMRESLRQDIRDNPDKKEQDLWNDSVGLKHDKKSATAKVNAGRGKPTANVSKADQTKGRISENISYIKTNPDQKTFPHLTPDIVQFIDPDASAWDTRDAIEKGIGRELTKEEMSDLQKVYALDDTTPVAPKQVSKPKSDKGTRRGHK